MNQTRESGERAVPIPLLALDVHRASIPGLPGAASTPARNGGASCFMHVCNGTASLSEFGILGYLGDLRRKNLNDDVAESILAQRGGFSVPG